jgi:hypothetical protein
MKKINPILFGAVLLATVAFCSSCKKTADPGPAGTNGKDGNAFPYQEAGTTLNLTGFFYSDDVSFTKQLTLPFYSTLEESRIKTTTPALRTDATHRVSANGKDEVYYITRYDSLSNCYLAFTILNDYNDNIYVNSFQFNAKTNITSTSYREIYTTYYNQVARTSGPYDSESSLDHTTLNSYGNSFEITNWNYNATTHLLTFDYNGLLSGGYNSTGNDLTVSGKVKATVRERALRIGQE